MKLEESKQRLSSFWDSIAEGRQHLRQSAVFENDKRLVVRLEVPGMNKGELDIEVQDSAPVVRGYVISRRATGWPHAQSLCSRRPTDLSSSRSLNRHASPWLPGSAKHN